MFHSNQVKKKTTRNVPLKSGERCKERKRYRITAYTKKLKKTHQNKRRTCSKYAKQEENESSSKNDFHSAKLNTGGDETKGQTDKLDQED